MEPNEVTALIVGNMMSGMLAQQQQQLGALYADVAGLRGVEAATGGAARGSGAAAAIVLAQERVLANPYHVPSLAAMAWAYEKTGDAALRRRACRQLVLPAGELGVAEDAPELVAARAVLRAPVA